MATFFLLLSLNPDVQRKAREEIDRVVGADRLPTLADRESLPYICAVFSEALRFHPIAPMGLPHMTTTEDEYEGYRIPKGAIVMPAAWYVILFYVLQVSCPEYHSLPFLALLKQTVEVDVNEIAS